MTNIKTATSSNLCTEERHMSTLTVIRTLRCQLRPSLLRTQLQNYPWYAQLATSMLPNLPGSLNKEVGWSRWQFLSCKSKTPVWKRLRKSWSARESLHSRKGEIVHSVGAWILEISGCGGVFGMATFAGTTQKCKACEKTVYLVDQLTADNKVYHKACFRCHHCKGTLKVTTQKENKQTLSNRGMPGHTFWHWSSCFAVLFGFFYRLYMDHFLCLSLLALDCGSFHLGFV